MTKGAAVVARSALVAAVFALISGSALALLARQRRLGSASKENRSKSARIILEDFSKPKHNWQEMNDPVMGGRSTGSFNIEAGLGHLLGEVKDVPFLRAPGFIQAKTVRGPNSPAFPDISTCTRLELVVKNGALKYNGYRVSFGRAHAPGGKPFAFGYKASIPATMFHNTTSDKFITLSIPFNQFTDFWDDATGEPIHSCLENSLYCPDERTLQNIREIAVWGEGVNGIVDISIKSIAGASCSARAE
jgi:Complex I intermediate-associated protein 30 (CIA30)